MRCIQAFNLNLINNEVLPVGSFAEGRDVPSPYFPAGTRLVASMDSSHEPYVVSFDVEELALS